VVGFVFVVEKLLGRYDIFGVVVYGIHQTNKFGIGKKH
jgi:hypothetical protein